MPNFTEDVGNFFRRSKEQLKAQAERVSIVGHRGTTGSQRENILCDFLKPFLPPTYQLTKSIIFDTRGHRSSEFDIVLSNSNWSPGIFKQDDIAPIFVENVVAVMEVKTSVDKPAIEDFNNKLEGLSKLTRKFYPTDTLVLFKTFNEMVTKLLDKLQGTTNLKCEKPEELRLPFECKAFEFGGVNNPVSIIRSVLFGYKGLSENMLLKHLSEMSCKPDLVAIFDIGAYGYDREVNSYINMMPFDKHHDLELACLAMMVTDWIDKSNSDRTFLKSKLENYL